MVINKRVTGKAMSIPAGIGIGLGISVLLTVLGCVAITAMVQAEYIGENAIGYGAMIILLLSAALGSLTASALVKHRRLLVCMILGVCYFALLLLINGIAFGGAVRGAGVTALLILGGSTTAALVNSATSGKSSKKYRKRHTG